MFNCTDACFLHGVINDNWRLTSISSQNGGTAHCDNGLVAGWYRFLLNGNNANMVNSPPPMFYCSTHAPIWWRGKRIAVELCAMTTTLLIKLGCDLERTPVMQTY